MNIIYSLLFITSTLLAGCFTVPGRDRLVSVNSYVNEELGCIHPLNHSIDRVEYIPAEQSLKSKIHYIDQCMINYSWGRGWTDRQDFKN